MKKFLLLLLVVLFVFTACDNSIKPIRFAFETEYEKQLKTPLTIELLNEGNITISNPPSTGMWYSLGYSLDGEKKKVDENTDGVTKNEDGSFEISVKDVIRLYAKGTENEKRENQYLKNIFLNIDCNQDCNVYGNIMSLLCENDELTGFEKKDSVPENAFRRLFEHNTHITSAVNLILPATTLNKYCYSSMFNGCTSLTQAPNLPATDLTGADYCYDTMFNGCTSLTQAPNLPARKLAISCYSGMFQGCKKLTEVQEELPATDLTGANSCYGSMFSGCTSLTKAPKLPATTLADYCYQAMFQGCTMLVQVQSNLPADPLVNQCYLAMFKDCTSLKTAPSIDAQKIGSSSCQYMFENSGLKELPYLCADAELGQGCYQNMFKNCDSLEKAILPKQQLNMGCYYGMFEDCDNLTEAFLPATDLKKDYYSCYKYMFKNCKNLNKLTCLASSVPESTGDTTTTYDWLSGVTKHGTIYAPEGVAWDSIKGYSYGIPSNWHKETYQPPQQ